MARLISSERGAALYLSRDQYPSDDPNVKTSRTCPTVIPNTIRNAEADHKYRNKNVQYEKASFLVIEKTHDFTLKCVRA